MMKNMSSRQIMRAFLPLLLLFIILTMTGCGFMDAKKYKEAEALFSNGQYDEAVSAFSEIEEYEDSRDFIKYIKTLQLAENGEYALASTTFETMSEFKDSKYLSIYYAARHAEKEQRYEDADALYRTIAIFNDSTARLKSLPDLILERDFSNAANGLKDDSFDATDADAFSALIPQVYSESDTRMLQDIYDLADKNLKKGDYEIAYELFSLLNDEEYSDSALRMQDCQFEYAKDLISEEKYEEAHIHIQENLMDYAPAASVWESLPDLILKRDFDKAAAGLYDGEYSVEDATAFRTFVIKKYAYSESQMMQDIYDLASSLLTSGEYRIAFELFTLLKEQNFSDSATRIQDCRFEHIKYLMTEALYSEACSEIETYMANYAAPDNTFEKCFYYRAEECFASVLYDSAYSYYKKAGNYSDAAAKAAKFEIDYQAAKELLAVEKYEEAHSAFTDLRDYSDSPECASESMYQYATHLFSKGDFQKAHDVFTALDPYKDSKQRAVEATTAILDAQYDAATQLLISEKYEEAIAAFEALDGYKDSGARIKAAEDGILNIQYNAAYQLLIDKKYEEAINSFSALKDFRDSASKIEEAKIGILDMQYDAANQLLLDKKYEEAIAAFTALNGHRDSNEKIDIAINEIQAARFVALDSDSYLSNGIAYIKGEKASFSWGVEFDVESYTVVLSHEDGTNVPLGTTSDTFKTLSTKSLQPGLYRLCIGAMPVGGDVTDIFWNEVQFGIPQPETNTSLFDASGDAIIVPFGKAYTIQTEIDSSGKARRTDSIGKYETLSFTLQVKEHKDSAYYEKNYADSYNLQGNESAVEFDLTLNNYDGSIEIVPQQVLLFTLRGQNDSITASGFQLMDAEIAGDTNIAVTSNVTTTMYKRYPYSAEQGYMHYLVVNSYIGGEKYTYWFEIIDPERASINDEKKDTNVYQSSGDALTVGSRSPEVKMLQEKLVELGLLSGQPDGHYGNYTAAAVKEMQRRYGMEQTGIADKIFLDKLYDHPESNRLPVTGTISSLVVSVSGMDNNSGIIELKPGKHDINWYAEGDVAAYYLYLFDGDENLLKSAEDTNATSFTMDTSAMNQDEVYELRIGALPKNGTPGDILWQKVQMILPSQTAPVSTVTPTSESIRSSNTSIDTSSSKEQISFVQDMLEIVGLLKSDNTDGTYNSDTVTAVKTFQNWVNEVRGEQTLHVSGICDQLTRAYLEYCVQNGMTVSQPTTVSTQIPTKKSPVYDPNDNEGETTPIAEPTPVPTVSAPVINIGSSVYQQDGVTYVDDSIIIFSWMADGDVQSYTVSLVYEDGTTSSLGITEETSKTVSTDQLTPGLYKLYVGATPVGGSEESTIWSELLFGVPTPKPATTPITSEEKKKMISYIDANSPATDIQTVQMALYQQGLLNADGIQPGVLDTGTLQAVAAFQQKINNALNAGLYVIDPTVDAFIDGSTLLYLLYQDLEP